VDLEIYNGRGHEVKVWHVLLLLENVFGLELLVLWPSLSTAVLLCPLHLRGPVG